MFERFDKQAKDAVVAAQTEARELGSGEIRAEHVLLGVLRAADGSLRSLLEELGLTHESSVETVRRDRASEPLGTDDADALQTIGIDLDVVRQSLEVAFGREVLDRDRAIPRRGWWRRRIVAGHIPFTAGAKQALVLSLHEARALRSDRIEAGHIVLGLVRSPTPAARRIIERHVAVGDLRARVWALLQQAA